MLKNRGQIAIIVKLSIASVLGVLSWLGVNAINTENRITTVETKQQRLLTDVVEVKSDVKDLLKAHNIPSTHEMENGN